MKVRVINKYADDETNTRTQTVLLMMVGGNKISGIHGAHLGPGVHIRLAATDPVRQAIPWVEYRNTNNGDVRTFINVDAPPDSINALPKYDMQCADCHNRPTHTFDLPESALDKALAVGDIAVTLPYVKKKSVELLKTGYSTSKEAADKLPATLVSFLSTALPRTLRSAYSGHRPGRAGGSRDLQPQRLPEPEGNLGTYPNNLGHMDFPGCSRCHDGSHTAGDGKTITQDCSTCHVALAMDEASPEILKTLGIAEQISRAQKQ